MAPSAQSSDYVELSTEDSDNNEASLRRPIGRKGPSSFTTSLVPPLTKKTVIGFGAFIILFCILFFGTPETTHSTRNDLVFGIAPSGSPLRTYPVPVTAGVTPKRFHSHNDYEQNVPLLKALSYGASSVEADIWLVDDELLVGHTESELHRERTLSSLYLEPLREIIQRANEGRSDGSPIRGVFESAPSLPLHLLIDLKTEGDATFQKLYTELQPLRALSYLTSLSLSSSSIPTPSAITIIGTGNTPLASIQALGNSTHPRDVFLDAVLTSVAADHTDSTYNASVSPLASVNFAEAVGWGWLVPPVGRRRVRELVEKAHGRGIQARFWNAPIVPKWARNVVWQMLLDEGVDWLNVDDLPAAQAF